MRLTAATVKELACPAGKSERIFFDEDLPGFGCRVRPNGAKGWVYQYAINGRTKRVALGPPNVVDAGKARAAAKDLAAQVRLNRDPAGEKAKRRAEAAETFGAIAPRFIERQRGRLKPTGAYVTRHYLLDHAKALHPLPLKDIDRRAVANRLTEVAETNGPAAANRLRSTLSSFFRWSIQRGYVDTNPAAYTDKATEVGARTHVITDRELGVILRSLDESDYATILRLLLLTGARRSEIGHLAWPEVDLDNALITLAPARTKISRPHVIPLSVPALEILKARRERNGGEQGFVFWKTGFGAWSRGKYALDARIAAAGEPVANWRPHDFRRCVSTWLHEHGVQPHVVELVLGHVGHQKGVAGVYNKALSLDERRRALTRWADHILGLASGEPADARIIRLR
jgi:integrase